MSELRGGRALNLGLRFAGEFTVIVLGVLVALGVDAWSDEREARILETELLESLALDLRSSLTALEQDNESTRIRAGRLEWFLRFPIGPGVTFPEDSIGAMEGAANVTAAYAPTLRTYETMIATGTFSELSNTEIRLALSGLKSASEEYSDYRNQATQQWNDTYAMTWLEFMGPHRLTGGPVPSVPNPLPPKSVVDALRSNIFRAVVDRRRVFLSFVALNGDRLAGEMEQALALIEEELQARGQ